MVTLAILLISSACFAEPLELGILREKKAIEIAKINEKYVAALEKLQEKYTKAGDLESALAVKAEIEKSKDDIKKGSGDPKSAGLGNEVIGRWKYQSKGGVVHYRVFTEDQSFFIYRGDEKLSEGKYELKSPTTAVVGKKVHKLRKDGKMDVEGKWVAEKVAEK